MNFLKRIILWSIGGIIYYLLETLFRGFSHWSMMIVGGICFVCIGEINEIISWTTPLWKQGIIGSIIITTIEFLSGCLLNIILKLNVWDYSNIPFNLLGQICLPFTILWFFLSIIGIILDDYLRYWLFHEEKPRYVLK